MQTSYQAKIVLTKGATEPDRYDGPSGQVPPNDFAVSRKQDGSTASVYGDDSWDWTPYSDDGRVSPLSFPFWKEGNKTLERQQLLDEMHWLMFLVIYKREGIAFSYATLCGYLKILRPIARYCEEQSIRIHSLLSSQVRLAEFISTAMKPRQAEHLSPLLSILLTLGDREVGFVVPGKGLLDTLQAIIRNSRKSAKQTAPIPTRIYSHLISTLANELNGFEAVSERVLAIASACAGDPFTGRTKSAQRKHSRIKNIERFGYKPEFDELLQEYGLNAYFDSRGLSKTIKGMSDCLGRIQMIAKMTIHVFSGMRDDEALDLPYECIEEPVSGGKKHCVIVGNTTKLNNGKRKRTRWITSKEGRQAIGIAQRIANLVYDKIEGNDKESVERNRLRPLFASIGYLGFAGHPPESKNGAVLPTCLDLANYPEVRDVLQPVIEERDLFELEQIDAQRAWRSESQYQVGKPWHLTTHQIRRSLALYAQRSGLVSLPSLRRQLQHITQEMSQYYAKGSPFAQNFIGDDKSHFGHEWQESTSISGALSYLINVIFSDDRLFGGHGNYVERRIKSGEVPVSRNDIMQKFKRGEIAYKETPLGGCVKVGNCNQVGFRLLDVDCISGCKNMVGKMPKLNLVITAQTRLVESLNAESVEFRMESADLKVLLAARDNLRNRERDHV